MNILCKNLPWKSLVFLGLWLLLSACPWRKKKQQDNFQKDSFPSSEHRSFCLLLMSQKLKYHGEGNAVHTGVNRTPAGCTAKWTLYLL